MTQTAELRAPDPHQVVNHPVEDDTDRYRRALLAALRVARAKAAIILLEIDDIGIELKDGRLTPAEAMRLCVATRIESLFPRESDGG